MLTSCSLCHEPIQRYGGNLRARDPDTDMPHVCAVPAPRRIIECATCHEIVTVGPYPARHAACAGAPAPIPPASAVRAVRAFVARQSRGGVQ